MNVILTFFRATHSFYITLLRLRPVVIDVLCFSLLHGYVGIILRMIRLYRHTLLWCAVFLSRVGFGGFGVDLALPLNLSPSQSLVHCNTKCTQNCKNQL